MGTLFDSTETIASLASPPGPAARGSVRISGPEVAAVLDRLFEPAEEASFPPRRASVIPGRLNLPDLDIPLPVQVYFWPGPRSYTGESLAELHLAGSPPLLEAVLAALYTSGARPAQPGEYTLRAFLSGRIDLVQAEAVLGVIDARGQPELAAALDQLAGGLSTHLSRLRSDLLDLLADLEAGLDFADEDLEFVAHHRLQQQLTAGRTLLTDLLARAGQRMLSSTQPRVVLAGPPNAGKSTLFNALVGHSAALVSAQRGTTRDYLAGELSLPEFTVTLVDTAGQETAEDGVLQAAQQLRSDQVQQADLVVWCLPADVPDPLSLELPEATPLLRVVTKADLASQLPDGAIALSAIQKTGLQELKQAIVEQLSTATGEGNPLVGSTAARCRESLTGAAGALDRALEIAAAEADQELLAIELREALEELGKIVGAVYTDDLLDRIFSKFCIGK